MLIDSHVNLHHQAYADDREAVIARARDAGATGWIVKPFDAARLVEAIRRVSA